jgi:hypothetical protein
VIYKHAQILADRLEEAGFSSGFDFAVVCPAGYYGPRSIKWGEPKSDNFIVEITAFVPRAYDAREVIGTGKNVKGYQEGPTATVTHWEPKDKEDAQEDR